MLHLNNVLKRMYRISLRFLTTHAATLLHRLQQFPSPTEELYPAKQMKSILEILQEDVADEPLAVEALQRIHLLDTNNEISAIMAKHCDVLVSALRTHTNCPAIRERCCRCLANIALLGNEAELTENPAMAAELRKLGSVGLVTNVLARGPMQMSHPAAAAWASTALLNLILRDDEAAAQAAQQNADVYCAVFLEWFALRHRAAVKATELVVLDLPQAAAIDACAGCIARLLSLEVINNAEVSFCYERVQYSVIVAVTNALLVFDGHDDITHKLWECTRHIAAGPKNIPLLCRAWHSSDNAGGKTLVLNWEKRLRHDFSSTRTKEVFIAGLETFVEITATQHQIEEEVEASPWVVVTTMLAQGDFARFLMVLFQKHELDELALVRLFGLIGNLCGLGDAVVLSETTIERLLLSLRETAQTASLSTTVLQAQISALWNVLNHKEALETCTALRAPDIINQLLSHPVLLSNAHLKANILQLQKKLSPVYVTSSKHP